MRCLVVTIGCQTNIQVGARDGYGHPDAVAPRALTPGTPAKLPVHGQRGFLAAGQSSRGLLPKGGTMSTAITRSVLQSLVVEDRPWTIEELIREQGERGDVEDAIADLHAAGLVNRINKRVVCASRAAIRADELNS
jgi:hypothetical protein